MKLPRVRFKVRMMMIAIAVIAMLGGSMKYRRDRFLALALHHRTASELDRLSLGPNACPFTFRGLLHRKVSIKYERAARYPWLPVAPDPPGLK